MNTDDGCVQIGVDLAAGQLAGVFVDYVGAADVEAEDAADAVSDILGSKTYAFPFR